MDSATRMTRMMCCFFVCIVFCVVTGNAMAQAVAEPTKTEAQLKLEEKAREEEKIKEKEEAAAKARQEAIEEAKAKLEEEIAKLDLPEDTSPRLNAKEVRITGNTLISTDKLLKDIPAIYNASGKPLREAEGEYLFDLRVLQDIIAQPGQPREVSMRTIQGFTQYLLSVYQDKNYAGIYVYVPTYVIKENKLRDEILVINVIEAPVSSVTTSYYTPENEEAEKAYLRSSAVLKWSPAKVDAVSNRKALDDFVNLLNLNPDRYVSAVVSKGIEPNTIAVGYNIYEANPWHWFFQIDNAGTDDREWTPRFGLINTNLFGIDDTFTAMLQSSWPWESDIGDNYSLYGSYDFPLWGPRLRLNIFGGYSEFDISGYEGIDFLGDGSFYGATLRYNVFQKNKWFFDVTGTLSHEESEITPSLFPQFLGTDIEMDLWGFGIDAHRRDDMSNTSFTFDIIGSYDASSQTEFGLARTGADPDFTIYTTTARHSRYLDKDKIHRASGSFQWITSDERLVPAKMTAFGGMYTVRGYEEYEIIADGGTLVSLQYEFDVVKYNQSKDVSKTSPEEKPRLRKLAPLVFFDYGRAKIEDPLPTENRSESLCSIGIGALVEIGDNFSGALYYGFPLKATSATSVGSGRVNVGLMMRW